MYVFCIYHIYVDIRAHALLCVYIYNIYIEKMPDYLNNNGRFICRFHQFFFGNFCQEFFNN